MREPFWYFLYSTCFDVVFIRENSQSSDSGIRMCMINGYLYACVFSSFEKTCVWEVIVVSLTFDLQTCDKESESCYCMYEGFVNYFVSFDYFHVHLTGL